MNALYLTQEEKTLFDGLSADLKEGWEVEEETLVFEDPDDLYMRYQIANFPDPVMQSLADSARGALSPEDIQKVAAGFDFTSLSQEQMAELFFVLGTRITTGMLVTVLKNVDSDEDIEGIAGLTMIRRMLMESM